MYWQIIRKSELAKGNLARAIASLLLVLWISLQSSTVQSAGFEVSVDRNTFSTSETATLTLKFNGTEPTAPLEIPNIPGLKLSDPSHSVQNYFSFVDGKQENSVVVEYQYSVSASKAGNYMIPALQVEIDGKMYKSQPILMRVTAPGKAPQGEGGVQLRVSVARTNVFIGEVVPVEVELYFHIAQSRDQPHLSEQGFTLGNIVGPTQSTRTDDGVQHNVATYRTYVVPAKAGSLNLGPASMSIQVLRSNARDFFGRYTDWHPVSAESEPLALNCQPVPTENRPAGYAGAVGNYTVTLSASPTNIAVGDPVTLKIAITGKGAIDNLTIGTPPGWDHFKVYPPTSTTQTTDDLGITGTKTFSLTVVPENMEVKEIPPFTFSYFDPEAQEFRSDTKPAIPLTIRPSAASLPLQTVGSTAPQPPPQSGQDIAPLKIRVGNTQGHGIPLVMQKWFTAVQTVPWIIAITAVVWRKRKDALENNPRLLRQRHVEQLVRNGMAELKTQARENQSESFYSGMFRLLQEQIGYQLDCPSSGITESVIEEKLLPAGIEPGTIDKLHLLFQACNAARYSKGSSAAELNSLLNELENVLNQLKGFKA